MCVSPIWKKVVGFAAWTSVFTARLQKTLTPTKEHEGLSFLASSAVNSYRDAGACRVDSPAGEARGAAARSGTAGLDIQVPVSETRTRACPGRRVVRRSCCVTFGVRVRRPDGGSRSRDRTCLMGSSSRPMAVQRFVYPGFAPNTRGRRRARQGIRMATTSPGERSVPDADSRHPAGAGPRAARPPRLLMRVAGPARRER